MAAAKKKRGLKKRKTKTRAAKPTPKTQSASTATAFIKDGEYSTVEPVVKLHAATGSAHRYEDVPRPPAPGINQNDIRTILTLDSANPWVYAAVNRTSNAISSVNKNFFKKVGGKWKRSDGTRLERLLEFPNPHQTYEDLIDVTVADLMLIGMGWWEKALDKKKNPIGLWRLRADRVKIDPDPKRYWKGILFEREPGEIIKITPEELVPFRQWSPLSDYWGISGLFAAQGAATWDAFARAWNTSFFRNGAVPEGTFETDSRINEDTVKRIEKTIQARVGHPTTWRKPMVLDSGLKFKKAGFTQHDMQFSELMSQARDEILAALGVPPAIVGAPITSGGPGGFREQRFQFYQVTILPMLRKIQATINRFLAPPDEKLEFDLNDILALVEDLEARTRTAESEVTRGIRTINEVRDEMGLAPVFWGDQWWAPLGQAAVAAPDRPARPDGLSFDAAQAEAGQQAQQQAADKTVMKVELEDYSLRKALLKVGTQGVRERMARRFAGKYKQAFGELLSRILRSTRDSIVLEKAGHEPQFEFSGDIVPMSQAEIVEFLAQSLKGELLQQTNVAGRIAARGLGVDFTEILESSPVFERTFNEWREQRLGSTANTFSTKIRTIADKARADGLTSGKAIQRIEQEADRLISSRIADLSVSDATTFSNAAVLEEGGDQFAFKQWVDLRDGLVRDKIGGESHIPENFPGGAIIRIEELFQVPGRGTVYSMDSPGDPAGGAEVTSKCRCGILLLTTEEARALGAI